MSIPAIADYFPAMPSSALFIKLPPEVYAALEQRAEAEMRDPRAEAVILLRQVLLGGDGTDSDKLSRLLTTTH